MSEADHNAVIGKMMASLDFQVLAKYVVPAVLVAYKDWMTEENYQKSRQNFPPPVLELMETAAVPNYHAVLVPMRDAPTLSQEPDLSKEIPLDFSKLQPPPQPSTEEKKE